MRVGSTAALAGGCVLLVGLIAAVAVARFTDLAAEPAQETTPFQRANAEWLLEHRLPCRGCHVIGEIDKGGGRLGPDLTDVRTRLDVDGIAAHITSPSVRVPTSIMPPVPMPDGWRVLLVRYLAGDSPQEASAGGRRISPETPGARHSSEDGVVLYATLCVGCHGVTGEGDGPNASYLPVRPARLADAVVLATRSDDWLFDMVARGGYVMSRHPYMPPYVDLLRPAQIRSVVAYLRQLCRCAGPSWGDRPAASATQRYIRDTSGLP